MATRGFLIRFIDIGLIVLFGFLMISDIEASSRVDLSSEGEADVTEEVEPRERAFVRVVVAPDGSFRVRELPLAPGAEAGAGDQELAGRTAIDGDATDQAPADGADPDPDDLAAGDPDSVDVVSPDPVVVADVDRLQALLARLAGSHDAEELETVVLIEPDPASAVQRTVDVMDVTDRLGLAKSLQMEIRVAGEGSR